MVGKVDLEFKDDAIDYIVEKAVEYKLGARGLRSICEAILTDAMFEIPSDDSMKKLVLDVDYVASKFTKSKLSKLKAAACKRIGLNPSQYRKILTTSIDQRIRTLLR